MEKITIKDDFIKLGQLLKLANLVESGAMAKEVIENGDVKYNGQIETRRGKKVYPGDIVEFNGESVEVTNDNWIHWTSKLQKLWFIKYKIW